MFPKLLAVLLAAGLATWYVKVGGRQVDESHVRTLYKDYLSAFDRGDGPAVCALFDDQVSGGFKSTSRTMAVKERIDKATACAAVDEFKALKERMEAATGQQLYTNFEYTIESVTIAPDKKSATVQVLMQTRVGTERGALLDMRSQQTDTVVRSLGRARFLHSEGLVSFYR